MRRTRLAVTLTAGLLVAGTATAVAVTSASSSPPAGAGNVTGAASTYSYYQSMMTRFGDTGSMMGGSTNGSMMSDRSGYRWMMGGATAPDWMRGAALPASMTNRSDDPATVMGALLADAPGSRITPAEAVRRGDEPPTGGTVNQETHRVTLTGMHASVVVVMAPAGGPAQTFRAAGMADPTIAVTAGARVDIEVINADPDTAQGFEVTTVGPPGSPTTTDGPVFPGAALWFLGDPTAAGMHTGTVVFTAATPGSYRYVSPVPGQARAGMVGSFVVTR